MRLDAVWWLVSPQNPLKPVQGMAPLDQRMRLAKTVAAHPRILVTDLERRQATQYTAATLGKLAARFGQTRFVWLMGADNLTQIPAWQHWTRIFDTVPIAVFDRPTYSLRALSGIAAQRFGRHRLPASRSRRLAGSAPPAWVFLAIRRHGASATEIRKGSATDAPRQQRMR